MRGMALLLVAVLAAGCASSTHGRPGNDGATAPPLLIPDLVLDHDHRDPRQHQLAIGLTQLGFADAHDLVGAENARLSDIQFFGNLSVVAINGRAGASAGGFVTLDLEGGSLKLLGRYRSGSEDNWYTKFSPDGKFVFLTANGGTSPDPALGGAEQAAQNAAIGAAARGIQIVDVQDPAKPRLVGYFPSPVRVINLAPFVSPTGAQYVFASMTNDRVGRNAGAASSNQLNYVSVLAFDPGRPSLLEVARWQPAGVESVAQAFPHDLAVGVDPLNNKALLFVAYWDAGAYVVDITRPDQPVTVSRIPSLGAGDHVHTFKPHNFLIGGNYYGVLAPETFGGEPIGTYRVVNLTDLRHPDVVASWTPPPGDLRNTEALLYSPHEFSLARERLFASQYHGGVWVLRLPDLVPEATWQKTVGDPKRTGDWAVDIETVVPYHDAVYAVDMNGGVVVLHEDALDARRP